MACFLEKTNGTLVLLKMPIQVSGSCSVMNLHVNPNRLYQCRWPQRPHYHTHMYMYMFVHGVAWGNQWNRVFSHFFHPHRSMNILTCGRIRQKRVLLCGFILREPNRPSRMHQEPCRDPRSSQVDHTCLWSLMARSRAEMKGLMQESIRGQVCSRPG